MATQRRMRFVRVQLGWMLATALALSLLGSLSYELFVVCSLVGLPIVAKLVAPFNVTPRWRRRLRWLVLLSLLGFGLVAIRRVLEIVPPGVVP